MLFQKRTKDNERTQELPSLTKVLTGLPPKPFVSLPFLCGLTSFYIIKIQEAATARNSHTMGSKDLTSEMYTKDLSEALVIFTLLPISRRCCVPLVKSAWVFGLRILHRCCKSIWTLCSIQISHIIIGSLLTLT